MKPGLLTNSLFLKWQCTSVCMKVVGILFTWVRFLEVASPAQQLGMFLKGSLCILPHCPLDGLYPFCYCLVSKSHLILWDPMGYSPPVSAARGLSQARIPERVAISFST